MLDEMRQNAVYKIRHIVAEQHEEEMNETINDII